MQVLTKQHKGFGQGYNAQAPLDADTMWAPAARLSREPNAKQQIEAMLEERQSVCPKNANS